MFYIIKNDTTLNVYLFSFYLGYFHFGRNHISNIISLSKYRSYVGKGKKSYD